MKTPIKVGRCELPKGEVADKLRELLEEACSPAALLEKELTQFFLDCIDTLPDEWLGDEEDPDTWEVNPPYEEAVDELLRYACKEFGVDIETAMRTLDRALEEYEDLLDPCSEDAEVEILDFSWSNSILRNVPYGK